MCIKAASRLEFILADVTRGHLCVMAFKGQSPWLKVEKEERRGAISMPRVSAVVAGVALLN